MYERVAVLGGGAFGVALSKLVARHAKKVILWCRDQEVAFNINTYHRHPKVLREIPLPKSIEASLDLGYALRDSSLVIVAVPLEALEEVLNKAQAFFAQNTLLVSTSKGIDNELRLSNQIIHMSLPHEIAKKACYLSGPSFAIELAQDLPTALTVASEDKKSAHNFQKHFKTTYCRLYYSEDVTGVLVGGALKNVIAIASGVCREFNLGKNAQASLITRGLAEMARLAKKMGGEEKTLMGLSGVGDLVLSATDEMSRNFKLGTFLAKGFDLTSCLQKIGSVVEGAKTAKAIVPLCEKYDVELPICHGVYQVLYENIAPKDAISSLLNRELKAE